MDEEIGTLSEYEPHEEILNALSSLILTILFLPVVVAHTYYVYQDLFTPERKSLDHRKKKPKISKGYKKTHYLTVSCIWCYWMAVCFTAIQYNFAVDKCFYWMSVFEKIAHYSSKILLNLTYIIRLDEVYGQSAYGYSQNSIKCITIAVIIWVLTLGISIQAFIIVAPHRYKDTDGLFPFYCQFTIEKPFQTYIGLVVLLFGVISSIAAVVLFLLPLNKVMKAASAALSASDNNTLRKDVSHIRSLGKMTYTGTKYKILVWCASFFTLLWIIVMLLGAQSYASWLIIFDFVVNSVSVILMAPYYPSNIYYERVCWLCIKCCDCDKSDNKYRSEAAIEDRSKRILAELSANVSKSQTGAGRSVDTIQTKKATDEQNDFDVIYTK